MDRPFMRVERRQRHAVERLLELLRAARGAPRNVVVRTPFTASCVANLCPQILMKVLWPELLR